MWEDLADAYAAVDWAVAQIPILKQQFESWLGHPPYLLVEELHPEMGQKLFKLEINRGLPPTFNAGVGAVINSIRTSLDILASVLAVRNDKHPRSDRHFPIYRSEADFSASDAVAKRKGWLHEADRQILESLKPYRGGDNEIFALHNLDIKRKHERLIKARLLPGGIIVAPEAYAQGLGFPSVWPGFQNGAVIAWTNIDATNCEFYIPAEITFDEADILPEEPVLPTLRRFAGVADSIIQRFGARIV